MTASPRKMLLGMGLFIFLLATIVIFYTTNRSDTTDDTPQTSQTPRVGLLIPYTDAQTLIKSAMATHGYVEGENVEYIVRLALTTDDIRTQGLAILEQDVDVIIVLGSDSAVILSELTTTTPIVFMGSEGSYTDQVLAHMAEQGAETNITGVLTTNFTERRFDLLMELDPTIKTVLVPYELDNLVALTLVETVTAKGEAAGVTIVPAPFSTTEDVDNLLANIPPDIDAIFLGSERLALNASFEWAAVALENGILLTIPFGETFTPQVLMGYGTSFDGSFQQAARLTAQIIEGVHPADLPIEFTELRLVISLGAAEALGIEVPNRGAFQIVGSYADTRLRLNPQATLVNPLRGYVW